MARVKKASGSEASVPLPIVVQGPNGEAILTSPALPGPIPVADIAARLVDELEKSDREATTSKARAVLFDNANASKEKPIDPRFPALVERTLAPKDWNVVLDRYEAWLELGDRRTEEAFIRRSHEQGPRILQDLHDAYIQVRNAREDWEGENDVVFAGMRDEANRALQLEKDRGTRSKTITEKDIELKCSSMFHDEWVAQESKRRRFKAVEDRAKACIEVAGVRCRVLEGMMARLR